MRPCTLVNMKPGAILLAACVLAGAQAPPSRFSPDVKQVLELTEAQVDAITALNRGYDDQVGRKSQRMYQIAAEGGAGIEAIGREMDAELTRVRMRVREVLTGPQRARLKILEDALKLQRAVLAAQCESLLEPPAPPLPGPHGTPSVGRYSAILVPDGASMSSCGTP
jgi:hypothetical protein